MEASNFYFPGWLSLVTGDMIQFLLWFTSDKVRTRPDLIRSMLNTAAGFGYTDKCLTIIDSGMVSDKYIALAFRTACKNGQLDTAQEFVQFGCINNQQMRVALHEVCSLGNAEIVNWLMSSLKSTQQERDSCMLVAAVTRGDVLKDIQLLVEKIGKNTVEAMSHALFTANFRNRVDVVDWLTTHTAANTSIKMECDVLVSLNGTMTLLAAACYNGNMAITRQLLHCVTPRTINTPCGDYEDSALHHVIWQATMLSNSLFYFWMLKSLHASNLHDQDVNVQYMDGKTLLHFSCVVGDKEGVEMLLSMFADTDITDDKRTTPIACAKDNGNHEIVTLLSKSLI